MLTIHQYTILCAPTAAQIAGIEALHHGAEALEAMLRACSARRHLIVKGLGEVRLPCAMPEGAFYVFADIRGTGISAEAFAETLLLHNNLRSYPARSLAKVEKDLCGVLAPPP